MSYVQFPKVNNNYQIEQTFRKKKLQRHNKRSSLSHYATFLKSANPQLDIPKLNIPHLKIKPSKFTIESIHKLQKIKSKLDTSEDQLKQQKEEETRQESLKKLKKGNWLQMWLDEALDPQGKELGRLNTLKRFQLDKKYLQSQNLNEKQIDQIYRSLYVYTQGLNNIWNEFATCNDTVSNNFWRAFTKLLENSTPYHTAFQKIQNQYISIVHVERQRSQQTEKQLKIQIELLQNNVKQLKKQMHQNSFNYERLKNQFKIQQSSLTMTQKAFNEQVVLRLRFEQKVNAMFTSYDEIKIKYEKLLKDLRIKNDLTMELDTRQNLLIAELQKLQAKNQETQRLFVYEKQKLKRAQKQLIVKRQQIYDLQLDLQLKNQKKFQKQQNIIQQLTSKKNLQTQYSSAINSISDLKYKLTLAEKKSEELIEQISFYREKNDDIYNQYQELGKQRMLYQQKQRQLEHKLMKSQKEVAQIMKKCNQLEHCNIQSYKHIQQLKHKNNMLTQQIIDKESSIRLNSIVIEDLKAAKQKYQRLSEIYLQDKYIMEKTKNQAVAKYTTINEQMEGHLLLLQSKMKEILELNNKSVSDHKVFNKKMSGLTDQIHQKDKQIYSIQQKKQQIQSSYVNIVDKIDNFQVNIRDLTKKLQHKQQYICLLEENDKRNKKEVQEKHLVAKQYHIRLQKINQELSSVKKNLSDKEKQLNIDRSGSEQETIGLRNMLEQYRKIVNIRVMHVHPMIYQDLIGVLFRTESKLQNIINNIEDNNKNYKNQLQKSLQQLKEKNNFLQNKYKQQVIQNKKNKQKIVFYQQQKQKRQKQLIKLKEQKNIINNKIQKKQIILNEKINNCQKYTIIIQTNKKQIQQLTNNINQKNKKLEQLIQKQKQLTALYLKVLKQKDNLEFISKNKNLKSSSNYSSQSRRTKKQKQIIDDKNEKQYSDKKFILQAAIQTSKDELYRNNSQTPHFDIEFIDVGVQTQKQKSFKMNFQNQENGQNLVQKSHSDHVQNLLPKTTIQQKQIDSKRIQPKEYKKALKITFMRHK